MSTEAKNIHLNATVLAALEAAAQRENRSVDEMAAEAVMAGLRDRKSTLERLFDRGSQIAAQHHDTPSQEEVPQAVRDIRRERTARNQ